MDEPAYGQPVLWFRIGDGMSTGDDNPGLGGRIGAAPEDVA